MEGTHEKGKVGMDVYGCLWMFMERDMGIFCNNFLELGDPNQKSFFGRGGGASPGYRTNGTHAF